MPESKKTAKDLFKKSGVIGVLLIVSAFLVFLAGLVALIDTLIKNL